MHIISVNKTLIQIALSQIIQRDVHLQTLTELPYDISSNIDLVIIGKSFLNTNSHLIHFSKPRIVLLDEDTHIKEIRQLQNDGFDNILSLHIKAEHFEECISKIKSGYTYICPQVKSQMEELEQIFNKFHLTEREIEIIDLLSKGLTLVDISEKLFLSTNTVIAHKRNILKKTGFGKMTQLIAWWMNII